MDKDIRQYLHYYLGCDFITPNSQGNLNAQTLHHVIALIENGVKIQLLLRKLESMTEEEASDVYTIERDRILHTPTNEIDMRRVNNAWQIVRLDHLDTKLFVVDGGVVFKVTEDNGKPMIEYTRNMPLIFDYLLSRGFDLFGLIESGAAINKEQK